MKHIPVTRAPGVAGALRSSPWKPWAYVLAGIACFAVLAAVLFVVDKASDAWQRSADRAKGTVTEVTNWSRFPGRHRASIEVESTYDGVTRRGTIYTQSDPDYEVGQQVVVLVDRDDPDRISVPGESNLSRWVETVLFGIPAAGGVIGVAIGLTLMLDARTLRRQRRHLSSLRPPPPAPPVGPNST